MRAAAAAVGKLLPARPSNLRTGLVDEDPGIFFGDRKVKRDAEHPRL
jgi:hypothetical protein